MLKHDFKSIFAEDIIGLILQKRAMGYVYEESEYTLFTFDRFCMQKYPDDTSLNQELALNWSEQKDTEHTRYQLNRITAVRQLALYMNSIGKDAYVIPYGVHQKCNQSQRIPPYIYTKDELKAIFRATDSYQYVPASPAMHLVIPVMFRLIYCCGLRPIEARRLRVENVDLDSGNIEILESKGHKDRIVVMSDDMLNLARKYHSRASQVFPDRVYFFSNNKIRNGGMYSMPWSINIFKKILKNAGIRNWCGRSPRAYDLRHTFATHRLYEWMQNGDDINSCLPYLSEYMGHSKLSSTAYYIHLVPEFYPKMIALGLESSANIIPEVCHEN